jgi:hypothetical protein
MGRRKKLNIDVDNIDSLQELMQEVYYDACSQIKDAQNTINNLINSVDPVDADDSTKMAKAKTDALKIKDSAIKIKLDVGKLQNDIIKRKEEQGKAVGLEAEETVSSPGEVKLEDFSKIREMIEQRKNGGA